MDRSDARTPSAAGEPAASPPDKEITVRNLVTATVCMLGFGLTLGLMSVLAGVVMVPMTREFHWTRAAFSLGPALTTWCGAVAAPFAGRFIDRVGLKPSAMIGSLVVGLALLALSRQTADRTTFYAGFAVLGLCMPLSLGYTKVIAALFKRNRGKMLALFGVETSAAFIVIPLTMGQIFIHYGWRMVFICFGAAVLSLPPLVFFLLREPRPATTIVDGRAQTAVLPGLTMSEIVRTQPFWILMTVTVIVLGPLTGAIPHIVPFLEQKGFSVTVAVTYQSVAYALGFMGSICAGFLLDRFNTAKVAAPSYVAMAVGMTGLTLVTPMFGGFPLLYGAAAFSGFAASSAMPMNTYLHTRFFGLRAFTEVLGIERCLTAVTSGATVFAIGYIYDNGHSYAPVFTFMILPPIVAATLYLFIGRYRYAADIGVRAADPAETLPAPAGAPPAFPAPAE